MRETSIYFFIIIIIMVSGLAYASSTNPMDPEINNHVSL